MVCISKGLLFVDYNTISLSLFSSISLAISVCGPSSIQLQHCVMFFFLREVPKMCKLFSEQLVQCLGQSCMHVGKGHVDTQLGLPTGRGWHQPILRIGVCWLRRACLNKGTTPVLIHSMTLPVLIQQIIHLPQTLLYNWVQFDVSSLGITPWYTRTAPSASCHQCSAFSPYCPQLPLWTPLFIDPVGMMSYKPQHGGPLLILSDLGMGWKCF